MKPWLTSHIAPVDDTIGGTSYIGNDSASQAIVLTNGPSLTTRRIGQTGTASAHDTPDPALNVEAIYVSAAAPYR